MGLIGRRCPRGAQLVGSTPPGCAPVHLGPAGRTPPDNESRRDSSVGARRPIVSARWGRSRTADGRLVVGSDLRLRTCRHCSRWTAIALERGGGVRSLGATGTSPTGTTPLRTGRSWFDPHARTEFVDGGQIRLGSTRAGSNARQRDSALVRSVIHLSHAAQLVPARVRCPLTPTDDKLTLEQPSQQTPDRNGQPPTHQAPLGHSLRAVSHGRRRASSALKRAHLREGVG